MRNIKHIFCLSCLFMIGISSIRGQVIDSTAYKLTRYAQAFDNFAKHIPQEKVYLHFDNSSYYQGDHIWFQCYLTTTELRRMDMSKTLYVELLNPGGEIIDRRILKIENGQCHGEFTLNRIPFYSGFYEVRAYTKYMLNFGEDVLFSRLLPVFEQPKAEGDFEERNMLKFGYGKYPMLRKKPHKEKKLNVKFFPEGGNLVQGLASQVAFEATDAYGNPIEITGTVINEMKEETARFSTTYDGRGVFIYTPSENKQKAIVCHKGKKYPFDLPEALPQGIVLTVDNLSDKDSIGIALQKNKDMPAGLFGLAVINRGRLHHFCLVQMKDERAVRFNIGKSKLLPGVSWVVLFNGDGNIVCDRLLFTSPNETLRIKATTSKAEYDPYEAIEMTFNVTDKEEHPVQSSFSISVKDGKDEIESGHNILTDLLLMSEIRGYVRNPSYYFEANDPAHRTALDQLLMVQGWRRYSWQQMTGTKPFDLKYPPERGIEVNGQVVSLVKKVPKSGVDVSTFLLKRGEDEKAANFVDALITDSMGRFSFVSDVKGKWNMILAVTQKGKRKDYRIILDRIFSPAPKRYRYADMQISLADTQTEAIDIDTIPIKEEENLETFYKTYDDSLAKAGNHEKILHLKEVTVTAKKRSKEKEIYEARTKSIAYYDVHSERDDITDNGKYIGDDIHELMVNMNKNFWRRQSRGEEYLQYKGRLPLFVINYKRTYMTEMDYNKYRLIRLEAIKSIYITEDIQTMLRYADPRLTAFDIDDLYGCAVLIETYPEGEIPTDPGKGVRKTWLEGYSQVKEFYSPDYSVIPQDPDYRRTLYWNPAVTPDKEGKAKIRFYNNSRCKKFKISAETLTPKGIIGVYKD